MDILILGLIFDIVGVFILTLVAIIDPPYRRVFEEKVWWKRYCWVGWRPIYRDTKTLEWKIKLNSMVERYDFIPPKHLWNIIGFLYILVGFGLQIKFYL